MDEVFVSKIVVDLTTHLVDEELANQITEDVREFILARMDDYLFRSDPYDLTSEVVEYELNWEANTTRAFSPEKKY